MNRTILAAALFCATSAIAAPADDLALCRSVNGDAAIAACTAYLAVPSLKPAEAALGCGWARYRHLLKLMRNDQGHTVTDPDPVPPPSDGKPAWLPRVQAAMAGLFVLGAAFTALSGYKLFVILAFVIDVGVIVWMMQQPWAKTILRRDG